MKKSTKKKLIGLSLSIVIVILAMVTTYFLDMGGDNNQELVNDNKDVISENVADTNVIVNSEVSPDLKVHFIDQTTPNMIQGISGIYERNTLISKEILHFLNFKWFRKDSFFLCPDLKKARSEAL